MKKSGEEQKRKKRKKSGKREQKVGREEYRNGSGEERKKGKGREVTITIVESQCIEYWHTVWYTHLLQPERESIDL